MDEIRAEIRKTLQQYAAWSGVCLLLCAMCAGWSLQGILAAQGGGGGGLAPPAGCLDNELVKANGTTGDLECEDSVTVPDNGVVLVAGLNINNTSVAVLAGGDGNGDLHLQPASTRAVKLKTSGTKQACDSGADGGWFYENTVSDSTTGTLYMCMESAANTFSYITIATGG